MKENIMQKLKFFTIMILFMLTACSSDKIEPGVETGISTIVPPENKVQALREEIVEYYEAVGTIRPRIESKIEAQVTAKVKRVNVRPGSKVKKGQALIVLDDRQFNSRLAQARQALQSAIAQKEEAGHAVNAAEAAYKQALAAFERTKKYFDSQAATSQDLENAESAHDQAKSGVKRARKALSAAKSGIRQAEEVVKEAQIALDYTTIRAQQDGEILQRMIEPGDLALPGKPLIVLQTAGTLRLEAYVREGLIGKVKLGNQLMVEITTLNKHVKAIVEEIVPYADPQTRTFLVKASLPAIHGLYAGMYGKLLIPAETHSVVMIPEKACQKIGQLEIVIVQDKDRWKTRYIKTGRRIDDKFEVLSGLMGNEWIGIKE
jgi:RND family efflux transporter MFP subunit